MVGTFPKFGLLFATAINQRESLGGEISRGISLKSNNLTIKNPKSQISNRWRVDFQGHRNNIFPGTMRSSPSWRLILKSNNLTITNLKSQISNLKSVRSSPSWRLSLKSNNLTITKLKSQISNLKSVRSSSWRLSLKSNNLTIKNPKS